MTQSHTKSFAPASSPDDWDFYLCEVDDKPAIISVDLHLADLAPNADLPHMVYISLEINKLSQMGYPAASELGELGELEEYLVRRVLSVCTARFCGRVTTDGRRDLIFFVRNADAAMVLLRSGMRAFPQYNYELGQKHDPEWSTYFEFLCPNEEELNMMVNNRALAKIERLGNPLTEKQPLAHTAYLPTEDDRDRFILEAIDSFFRILKVEKDRPKQGFWSVRFVRPDFVDTTHLNPITSDLIATARASNGIYAGWEVQ